MCMNLKISTFHRIKVFALAAKFRCWFQKLKKFWHFLVWLKKLFFFLKWQFFYQFGLNLDMGVTFYLVFFFQFLENQPFTSTYTSPDWFQIFQKSKNMKMRFFLTSSTFCIFQNLYHTNITHISISSVLFMAIKGSKVC